MAPSLPTHTATTTIVSPHTAGTPDELRQRGEQALVGQRWRDAIEAFEALLAAEPQRADAPAILLGLGMAYERLGERDKARILYQRIVDVHGASSQAKSALVRQTEIAIYQEQWSALVSSAEVLLARADIEPFERVQALAARALGRIEQGDEEHAMRDVQEGLDLADTLRLGTSGRLPVAVAELRYVLGEVRRLRSEKIRFQDADPTAFFFQFQARCDLLYGAQSAYTDAIRSIDPRWALRSGLRIGEMYRTLHRDVMAVPPPPKAKSAHQKQLAMGLMHRRYRVLLEKGLDMMDRVLALGAKMDDAAVWLDRAATQKAEIQAALDAERIEMAKLPFTEEELDKTLELLRKKYEK